MVGKHIYIERERALNMIPNVTRCRQYPTDIHLSM